MQSLLHATEGFFSYNSLRPELIRTKLRMCSRNDNGVSHKKLGGNRPKRRKTCILSKLTNLFQPNFVRWWRLADTLRDWSQRAQQIKNGGRPPFW